MDFTCLGCLVCGSADCGYLFDCGDHFHIIELEVVSPESCPIPGALTTEAYLDKINAVA